MYCRSTHGDGGFVWLQILDFHIAKLLGRHLMCCFLMSQMSIIAIDLLKGSMSNNASQSEDWNRWVPGLCQIRRFNSVDCKRSKSTWRAVFFFLSTIQWKFSPDHQTAANFHKSEILFHFSDFLADSSGKNSFCKLGMRRFPFLLYLEYTLIHVILHTSRIMGRHSLTHNDQFTTTSNNMGCNSTMRVTNCTSCLLSPSCVWCMPNLNTNAGSTSFCAYQSERNSVLCQGTYVTAASGSVCEMKSVSISNVSVVLMTIFVTACCCSCFTSLCYCLLRSFSKSQRQINPTGGSRIEEAEAQWVPRHLSASDLCLTAVSADPGYAVAEVDSAQSRDQSTNLNRTTALSLRYNAPSGRRFSADCNSADGVPISTPLTIDDDVSLYTRSDSFNRHQMLAQVGEVRALSVRIFSHLTHAATESVSALSSTMLPRQPMPTATYVPDSEAEEMTAVEPGVRLESRQVWAHGSCHRVKEKRRGVQWRDGWRHHRLSNYRTLRHSSLPHRNTVLWHDIPFIPHSTITLDVYRVMNQND